MGLNQLWNYIVIVYNAISNTLSGFLGNLLSGFVGAAILYYFQKRGERRKEKQAAKNLAIIIENQLENLELIYKNPGISEDKEILRTLTLWRDTLPFLIELFPSDLASIVIWAFSAIELSLKETPLHRALKEGTIEKALKEIKEFIKKNK